MRTREPSDVQLTPTLGRPATCSAMDTEEDLDRLYSLPLQEFAQERDSLAGRLQDTGEAELAQAVQALEKPTLSAWVINQLVRNRRDLVRDLLAAVDRRRAAHVNALEDRADTPPLSEATKDERDALAQIEKQTPAILDEVGYVASRATIERAIQNLKGATYDPRTRSLLEVGRMVGDIDPEELEPRNNSRATPSSRMRGRPPRDTIDLEMGAALRQAELKRAEQEKRRRTEESRREEEERQRNRQRKLDALRRTIETARAAENRFERDHINAERERNEAERRLEEKTRIAERAAEQLEAAREERAQSEAQLEQLKTEAHSTTASKA